MCCEESIDAIAWVKSNSAMGDTSSLPVSFSTKQKAECPTRHSESVRRLGSEEMLNLRGFEEASAFDEVYHRRQNRHFHISRKGVIEGRFFYSINR